MCPGITLGPTCSHSTRKRNKFSRKQLSEEANSLLLALCKSFDQLLELAWESHRAPRNGQGGNFLLFICCRLSPAVDRPPVRFWLQEGDRPPA